MGITYRLDAAILAVRKKELVRIPEGSHVTLRDGPLNGHRMVDVVWDDQTVTMFTVDLLERAAKVPQAMQQSGSSAGAAASSNQQYKYDQR